MPTERPVPGSFWRHLKRGTIYEVTGFATIQTDMDRRLDGSDMVLYRERGQESYGTTYVRSVAEFMDGRFELYGRFG